MSEKEESSDYSDDINERIRELSNIQSYAGIRDESESRSEKWDQTEKLWDEIHEITHTSSRGKEKEILEILDKILKINPDSTKGWFFKAVAFNRLKRYDEALECCDKAIELDEKNRNPYSWYPISQKGIILSHLERYDEALECFDKAIEMKPDSPMPWSVKGLTLILVKRFDEALECCDKAIEFGKDDPRTWNDKKRVLEKMGRLDEALECCDKAIELDEKNTKSLMGKVLILEKQKKFDEALECCDRALEFEPNDYSIMSLKLTILRKLKKNEEFLELSKVMLELEPNDFSLCIIVIVGMLKMEKYDDALKICERILQFEDTHTNSSNRMIIRNMKNLPYFKIEALDFKARIYDRFGRRETAMEICNIGLGMIKNGSFNENDKRISLVKQNFFITLYPEQYDGKNLSNCFNSNYSTPWVFLMH